MKLDPIRIIILRGLMTRFASGINLPDEGVDLGDVDIVQLLDGSFNLMLVGLDVADEDKGVVVLDLLHGGLGGQRVLDDGVGVHLVPLGSGLAGVLRVPAGKISNERNTKSQSRFTWES